MRLRIILSLIIAAVLLSTAPAFPGEKDIVIFVTRMGGDSASAQPYIDKFLRYVESTTGWPADSAKGSFQMTKDKAQAFVASDEPGIGIMDPPLYFEFRKAWKLQAILQVESKDLVSERLHIVVKDPAFNSLADLKGKRLWTTLADFPKYVSKIVLNDQADAAAHFDLKKVGQALKGVRGVIRGDCEATILDDEQFAEAKKITGGQDLRAIVSSRQLPPIPVVVFGAALSAADKKTLVSTLTRMCGADKGREICEEMHIGRFTPVNLSLFSEIQKRYDE